MMVVLLGFTAMSVDVGFFLRHRAVVQHAVDAAALAGAQELPDDADAAEQLARDYAEANGIDPDDLEITFRCTSDFVLACDPSSDKWDTIQIEGSLDVPFFFAPVLKLTGATDKCWFAACPVVNSAAGCRGLCGSSPFQAVDVVVAIDHTASLSSSELDEIKDGTLALYEYFDESKQFVGLAVTPPVEPGNHCDSIDSWGDPEVYVPVPITNNYQTSPGVLDYSSALVSTTTCLDRPGWGELPGAHTKLGEPIKAAKEELVANGRPGEKWGIVLLSDGAANVYNPPTSTASTGLLGPSGQAAVTSGSGDNNGFDYDPTGAFSNGGGYARDTNSGNNTSTSCGSGGKDRHQYYDFDVSLPANAEVDGIELRLDAWANGWGSSTRFMCVELSWDGGSSWTSAQSTSNLSTSQNTKYVGGSSDDWGHAWTEDELSNANLRVRVTNVANSTSREFYLDWLALEVFYSVDTGEPVYDGPCDNAYQQAEAAKALGIEVFVIAWGADDECDNDPWGSTWHNVEAVDLLQAMATDEFHFFNEPKSADLEPIFQIIGTQLATGSRLVPISTN